MDDKIIPHLVARFLSWKLPPDFSPDAGISFAPKYNNGTPEGGRHEPSGTNLLNAEQAFSMFRHVLDHPDVTTQELVERLRTSCNGDDLEAAASRLSEMDAELRRIEENLGEYIDRVELVDVAVALAFETARAALEQQQKGEKQ